MARILCIDDHTYALASTTHLLRNQGHRVFSVSGTSPVLQAVADEEVDLLVLDCHAMANCGDLVAAVRILRPDLPVVMTSGFCSLPCDKLRQADGCVQKGNSAALAHTIEAVLCAAKYGLCRSIAA